MLKSWFPDLSEGTRGPRSSSWALRVCLHHVASPLHQLTTAPLAWLHRHPRYNPSFAYLGRRLRNQVRRLPSERDTVGGMHIFAYLRPYLFQIVHVIWTARGCVDEFSFYGPLRSETGFRHYLPIVLWIHTLPVRTCIGRIAGRCCRNYVWDRSRPW